MTRFERRRFDHLAAELSVALGLRVPRHPLWLASAGHLESAARLAAFCRAPLGAFLSEHRLPLLAARANERLVRAVAGFDPAQRTPEEALGALFGAREIH